MAEDKTNNETGHRMAMVDTVEADLERLGARSSIAMVNDRVLTAMRAVPRHRFVPENVRHLAYRNRPLPIGHGQTISQPVIVALMTVLADVSSDDVVLEVGTGSGYQAAVLAELASHVYSIEIVAPLGETAKVVLADLDYKNITTRVGDGYAGWPEHAPYDAIVVTAAPDHIPPALVEQLKPGGRMVIPVGDLFQELMVLTKQPDGTTLNEEIIPVRFVPLTREDD